MTKDVLLQGRGLHKSFSDGNQNYPVLKNVNFSLKLGEVMALTGPSGSGKSTLLNLVGLLDRPTEGEILFHGEAVELWDRRKREDFRAKKLGFVFQRHLLLPEFSLFENVAIPLARELGWGKKTREKVLKLIDEMGLTACLNKKPGVLSGGEAQRGAICRALIAEPDLLLMDEPTGNLDPSMGKKIIEDVMRRVHTKNQAMVLVTHNLELASLCDRHFILNDHQLESSLA